MSTIKVNTLDSTTGSTITIPTGKTFVVTDTGALTIGGTAITVGATQITSSSATAITMDNTGSPTVNITGKSLSVVSVDASSGTSTTHTVTLPPAANFSTCAINVVSKAAHGAGNKIIINNNGGTEVFTLYSVSDYCEIVSDGTNVLRSGKEYVTVRGEVTLNANRTVAANTIEDCWAAVGSSGYTVNEDLGSYWNTTNDDFTAPFAGEFFFQGNITHNGYYTGWGIKKNGTFVTALQTADTYGNVNINNLPYVLAKDDVVTYWICNTMSSSSTIYGSTTPSAARCGANWWCTRRY